TSCRIKTAGKVTFGPPEPFAGKMEARLQGPAGTDAGGTQGQGLWPAFWMLGTNIDSGQSWPGCGEIDIMEHINNSNTVPTTLHSLNGTTQGAGSYVTSGLPAPVNNTFSAYHTYALTWDASYIGFWLDGVQDNQYAIGATINATADEFHRSFFLLFN